MKTRLIQNKYPKSVLLVVISSLDYDSLTKDSNFQEFHQKVSKNDKNGRIYKINPYMNKEINNLVSFFTGSRSELHGIKGNLMDNQNKINYFDNIFKRIKKNNIQNTLIGRNIFFIHSFS